MMDDEVCRSGYDRRALPDHLYKDCMEMSGNLRYPDLQALKLIPEFCVKTFIFFTRPFSCKKYFAWEVDNDTPKRGDYLKFQGFFGLYPG